MFSDKRVVCDGCANEFNEEDVYVVNDEFDDKRIECQDCHNFQIESSEEIMCDECGEYFDLVHVDVWEFPLVMDGKTVQFEDLDKELQDQTREYHCPYCGAHLNDYDE